MEEKNRYVVPSGLKTRDGKDIMCYTAEFYVKNKEKIDRIIKRCEEILSEDTENEEIEEIEEEQEEANNSKEKK